MTCCDRYRVSRSNPMTAALARGVANLLLRASCLDLEYDAPNR